MLVLDVFHMEHLGVHGAKPDPSGKKKSHQKTAGKIPSWWQLLFGSYPEMRTMVLVYIKPRKLGHKLGFLCWDKHIPAPWVAYGLGKPMKTMGVFISLPDFDFQFRQQA